MRTKDELVRAAQREVAGYRQQAVMQAESARRAAYAAHPALAEADNAHMRAGLGLAKAAALGGSMETARAALLRADEALAAAARDAGYDAEAFTPRYHCPLCGDTPARWGCASLRALKSSATATLSRPNWASRRRSIWASC